MRLLLDTHVVLWWVAAPEQLAPEVVEAIAQGDNEVYLSAASVWEIAIKAALGKVTLNSSLQELVEDVSGSAITELPIRHTHAMAVQYLPPHHRDPFDRVLIAQSLVEQMTLVTADQEIFAYEGDFLNARTGQ